MHAATAKAERTRIERRTFIEAPRSRVWSALTTPSQFGIWFGAKCEGEFSPGARLRMISTHPGECQGVAFDLTVEAIDPERSFAWSWDPGVPDPDVDYSVQPKTRVEFLLEEQDGGTLVTVTESGFDRFTVERRARLFEVNSRGWEHQMESLAQYVGETL